MTPLGDGAKRGFFVVCERMANESNVLADIGFVT